MTEPNKLILNQDFVKKHIEQVLQMWVTTHKDFKQDVVNGDMTVISQPSRSAKSRAKTRMMEDWKSEGAVCLLVFGEYKRRDANRKHGKWSNSLIQKNIKMEDEIETLKRRMDTMETRMKTMEKRLNERIDGWKERCCVLKGQNAGWENAYFDVFKYPDNFY